MIKKDKGIFKVTVKGDLDGCRYIYLVNNHIEWKEAVDPYAKSLSANGEYGIIIDVNKTKMDLVNIVLPDNYLDHVIYEISIRDMINDEKAGVKHPRKYLGLAESGSSYDGYLTALDYIESLKVTMVQLMPVIDFGSVDELDIDKYYNWGYDPNHYYALEGSYSTDPNDGYLRIMEFKTMIKAMHKKGLAVCMDLVYNHVFLKEKNNLDKIVPNYYFRMDEEGNLSNGSLCGNDYESKSIMGRRYLIDCCLNWVKEYDIDAFRFDLMSITDIETINLIVEKIREIKPNFVIYGEGWDMPTLLKKQEKTSLENSAYTPSVAFFSDRFRDAVKGYGSNDVSEIENVKNCLTAGIVDYGLAPYVNSPNQTINYVECHDNLTLWDKLVECCGQESEKQRKERQKLINACVLIGQGIPFLHSGQEFCRTKNMDDNSYNSGDEVNKIDYDRMIEFYDVVEYTKSIISLRKDYSLFRLKDKDAIEKQISFYNLDCGALLYRIESDKEILDCFINPSYETIKYSYNKEVKVVVDDKGYLKEGYLKSEVMISPITLVVANYEK